MTQEEALEKYQAMYPAKAHLLAVEHSSKIGCEFAYMSNFSLWDYSEHGLSRIHLTSSDISFEDAFEQLAAKEMEVSA